MTDLNSISLDSEQLRILNWRAASKDIAAVVGIMVDIFVTVEALFHIGKSQ